MNSTYWPFCIDRNFSYCSTIGWSCTITTFNLDWCTPHPVSILIRSRTIACPDRISTRRNFFGYVNPTTWDRICTWSICWCCWLCRRSLKDDVDGNTIFTIREYLTWSRPCKCCISSIGTCRVRDRARHPYWIDTTWDCLSPSS